MGRQGKGRCQGEPQLDMYRSNREKDQQGKGAEGLGRVWTVKPAGRPLYGGKGKGTRPHQSLASMGDPAGEQQRWERHNIPGGAGLCYPRALQACERKSG